MSQSPRPIQRSEQRTPQRFIPYGPERRFDLDQRKKPQDMDYQWCAKTMMGMELTEQMITYTMNGWKPVPPERHPELTGGLATQGNEIVRGGQVLMERPKEFGDQVREMDEFAARSAVANQMQRLKMDGYRRERGQGVKRQYENSNAIVED